MFPMMHKLNAGARKGRIRKPYADAPERVPAGDFGLALLAACDNRVAIGFEVP